MMRKVYLDELPHKGRFVDWISSIGYSVRFEYDNYKGILNIVDYNKEKCKLQVTYNNNKEIIPIDTSSLSKARVYFIIKKYETIIVSGNISVTHPELVKYFVNYIDAVTHKYSSNAKVLMQCPDCGKIKPNTIYNLTRYKKINCECGDTGFSYPEKFIIKLLMQLDVKYSTQYNRKDAEWITNGFRYDFYINNSCIIETHGSQHYNENKFSKSGNELLKDRQNTDRIKEKLAKENGIINYITLDCRESNMEWIKNSVMKSKLPKILKFTENDINWKECEEFALSNIVKKVCDYKNNHTTLTCYQIGKIFKLSKGTILSYLKKGKTLGWCEYSESVEFLRRNEKLQLYNKEQYSKRVEVYKDEISLGIFPSVTSLCNSSGELFNIFFSISGISNACNGRSKTHKGFIFKYVNQ